MAYRTVQSRGYCSKTGYARVDRILRLLCTLGNAALQERRDAWKMARENITYQDQCKSLTLVRKDDPDGIGALNVSAARGALQRVDKSMKAFFRRCKEGRKPGFPRFKTRRRYKTIEVNDVRPNQVRLSDSHVAIRINGLPTIRARRTDRHPDTTPRSIRITRRRCGVTVDLVYEHEAQVREPTGRTVGIDLGVRKRLTLSNGEKVEPARNDRQRIRRLQRAVARSRRGSRGRDKRVAALAAARRKQAVASRNACHRITSALIGRFDVVTVEKLAIGNMTRSAKGTVESPGRRVKQKSGLNRAILEQGWGHILDQLNYKAEWAGRTVVEAEPAYSSQDCSTCGTRREKPDGREFWTCAGCGTRHDRDVNAATNIHRAGILALGSQSGERVAA